MFSIDPWNGPNPICVGCGKLTTWQKPFCEDCLSLAGENPRTYCALCEVGLTVDRHGVHTNKTGGYAGMCAAVTSSEERS